MTADRRFEPAERILLHSMGDCREQRRRAKFTALSLLAMAAVGGVYLDLPRELVIGPTWLLLTVIAVLLAPTIVTHRIGRHSFSHSLGIVNNGIISRSSVQSVCLLGRRHRTKSR